MAAKNVEEECHQEEPWKVALRTSRDFMFDNFDITQLPKLLKAFGGMTQQQCETIENQENLSQRNEKLINWLLESSEDTFKVFLQALRYTNQFNIEDEINRNLKKVKTAESETSQTETNKEELSSLPKSQSCNNQMQPSRATTTRTSKNDDRNKSGSWFNCIGKQGNMSPNYEPGMRAGQASDEEISYDHQGRFSIKRKLKNPFRSKSDKQETQKQLIKLHKAVRKQNNRVMKKTVHHPKGMIVVTGGDCAGCCISNCNVYDNEFETWNTSLDIPNTTHAINLHTLVVFDGLLCAVGGYDHKHEDNKWLQAFSLAETRWISCPTMPKMTISSAVYLKPNIFAIAKSEDMKTNKLLRMGMDFIWHDIANLTDYFFQACAILNKKIYCFGENSDQHYEYNPATNTWRRIAFSMRSEPKNGFQAVGLYGIIMLVGGYKSGVCERYNPDDNTWDDLTTLPVPVQYPAVATDGERVYVIGGRDNAGTFVNTMQIYDYKNHEWKLGVPYPLKVACAAAAFVPAELLHT